ncbi:hypothetical protein D3C79_804110 [compost metagenome]
MLTLSVEAMHGPASTPNLPTGMPGELCRANRASQGNSSKTPSSSMRLAPEPPWPSSAGWKNRCKVPRQLRSRASSKAAARSMAVWPSWPQACILPGVLLAQGSVLCSWIGRASSSARRPNVGP